MGWEEVNQGSVNRGREGIETPIAAQRMEDWSWSRMRYGFFSSPSASTYSNQLLIAMIARCSQITRKKQPRATFSPLALIGAARPFTPLGTHSETTCRAPVFSRAIWR